MYNSVHLESMFSRAHFSNIWISSSLCMNAPFLSLTKEPGNLLAIYWFSMDTHWLNGRTEMSAFGCWVALDKPQMKSFEGFQHPLEHSDRLAHTLRFPPFCKSHWQVAQSSTAALPEDTFESWCCEGHTVDWQLSLMFLQLYSVTPLLTGC